MILILKYRISLVKVVTVPFEQEECECEGKAVVFEDPLWEQDDEGQITFTTKMGFIKVIDKPITVY